MEKEDVLKNKQLNREQLQWEHNKTKQVDQDRREVVEQLRSRSTVIGKEGGEKRSKKEKKGGRKKRRKYAFLKEDWGAPPDTMGQPQKGGDIEGLD